MTAQSKTQTPSLFKVILMASRPKTLPAAASPVIVGAALAVHASYFELGPALAALLGALFLQIGANFANDVFDFQHGADTEARVGPTRVTQAGLLTPAQVKTGMFAFFGLATLVGIYLTLAAGWPVVVIGLSSILVAILYTAGPYPLGYNGLGELFVFLFFGVAAVCGTYYVQARDLSPLAVSAAVPMGLLASGILTVNNIRDYATDIISGKKTLAVKLGLPAGRLEYVAFIALVYIAPLAFWLSGLTSAWVLLAWLSAPLAARLIQSIYRDNGPALNAALARTGQLELIYALLFSLGLIIAR
jgi:1,4-dihydroxy-2-naphthoate octaprenyltransferase